MKGLIGPCVLTALTLLRSITPALAVTEIQQCSAARNRLAAKYHSCREQAEAKAARSMTAPDYAKCAEKFADKWDKARAKYGLDCIAELSAPAMDDFVALQRDIIGSIIAGTAPIPECGSDWIDVPREQCDGSTLGGASCESLDYHGGDLGCTACAFDTGGCTPPKYPATGVTVSYSLADDGAYQTGEPLHYIDNGDGTITDPTTRLMWEKKIKLDDVADPDDLHDADNRYSFGGECVISGVMCGTDAECGDAGPCDTSETIEDHFLPDAPTIFDFVAELNAAGFAGYDDWRLPNIRELQSLYHYGSFDPAISAAFHGEDCGAGCADLADPACSCTGGLFTGDFYWSSTTSVRTADVAFTIEFLDALTGFTFKAVPQRVRAVRSID